MLDVFLMRGIHCPLQIIHIFGVLAAKALHSPCTDLARFAVIIVQKYPFTAALVPPA